MELGKLPLIASVVLACSAACGGPQGRGGPGASCFRDDECEFGLICAAVGSSERTCTSDVNGLVEQYRPAGLPVPAEGGTTNGGAPGAGGTAAGGAPSGAGAPAAGGATAGAPASGGTPSGGTGETPSGGGAPAEPAAGATG